MDIASPGDAVGRGDVVAIVVSMKMEIEIDIDIEIEIELNIRIDEVKYRVRGGTCIDSACTLEREWLGPGSHLGV